MFKGIPFAAPPVGTLRHRPPVGAAAVGGVRDGTRFGPICPQVPSGQAGGVMRIFGYRCADGRGLPLAQRVDPVGRRGRRPTMVWIHGGGFRNGNGSAALVRRVRPSPATGSSSSP